VSGRGRLALLAAVLAASALAAVAGAGPRVTLPRDHFPHPSAGIEWWYASGLVRGRDGHRYTVFFTLFRRGDAILPISQVIDLTTGKRVGSSERAARARLEPGRLDVDGAGARLRYDAKTNRWTFAASAGGYALTLLARPEKPYVLHGGGTGFIEQSVGGPSAYYSATRMAAQGTIAGAGRRIAFTGTAWFDHQWGSFEADPRAFDWDWFSCRFDDRTELMLYRFRDRQGHPLAAFRNGTFVARDGRSRSVRQFDVSAGQRAIAAARHRWPLDWRLDVPAERLRLELRAIVPDQLFHGVLVPTFWEGAATVTGTKRGICFVEETYR
jgi:predicted secreted hydrolase